LDPVTLSIDGKTIRVPSGTSLLDAADQLDIKIPRLCHHPDLEPFGACRLCLVEDEKSGRLMASCVTPAAPEMEIRTDSSRIKKHRRNIVRLMIAEHPESCVVCSKGNRCRLRHIAAQLGIGETDLYPMPNHKPLEQANPFIIRDLSKCILCGKCIRADHELVVVGAIDYNLRGFESRPATAHELGLEHSDCTFCGTCVSMCPTGALSVKDLIFIGTPEKESDAICGFCSVGCALSVGVFGNRVVETNPADRAGTVNGATLCVRGHFANDYLNSENRIADPMVRNEEARLTPTDWDTALDTVVARLKNIQQEYGPQSIAFLGSSKCTNEENYLLQKIARTVFKTNNIDNGGTFYGRRIQEQVENRLAGRFRTQPLSGLETAEVLFVLEADPGHTMPVAGYYIKRAARKGIPVVVAGARTTELTRFASVSLPIIPGSALSLVNTLAALLYEGKEIDRTYIKTHTSEFEAYENTLKSRDSARSAEITGLNIDRIKRAATLFSGRKITCVVGDGILQSRHGRAVVDALVNLLLMNGNLHPEKTGLYLLSGENNQTGAWDMGAVPDALPGRQHLKDDNARKEWERLWQVKISPDHGLDAVRMVEEAEKGNLKALFIMGENPLRSFPQPDRVRKAFENLDFIAVQDILRTETVQTADVVLPGVPFSEKKGAFTNLEGRIQSFEPAVIPLGNAKPDWEILGLLIRKAGSSRQYESVEQIRGEIRENIPMYKTPEHSTEPAWIKSEKDETRILFTPEKPNPESPSDTAYPYTGILGSSRYHFGSGTRTATSNRIQQLKDTGAAELSIQECEKLGLSEGDTVQVRSRWGTITRRVHGSDLIDPGVVYIPRAFNGNDVMELVKLSSPRAPDFSGWNTVAVDIEPVMEGE